MKPKTKKTISMSILILIVALFIYYIKNHVSDFRQIALINPGYLIPLVILGLIISYTNGLIIKYLVESFKIKLKFKEWFGLSIITSFYNTIMPFRGGLIAKAAYLKKKHSFPYTHFLSTLAGVYVINFLAASLLGLISLGILYLTKGIFNWIVFLIFLAFFLPLLFIVLFSPVFPETKNNFINKFIKVMNGWHTIRKNRKIVILASLVIIAQILLSSVGAIIAYGIFGIKLAFISSLFLSSISVLGIIISITPGALGIAEAISVFSALIIGITPVQSLSVAILGRVVSVITIFTLGPIFSYLLLKHKPKNET
jgi:uncharacterized protein (TIRG00374 family)